MTMQSSTAQLMAEVASQVVAVLDDAQRAVACYPFPNDEERRRFYWTPTDHGGIALHACGDDARALIMQLVASGLSPAGFNTLVTIISLQHVLARNEGWQTRKDGRPNREPLEYQLSIFGEPSQSGSWGWRFGGHHASLSYALIDGNRVAPTPSFLGASPADTPIVGGALLRPLGRMEDLGRELVRSLDEAQLATAVLAPAPPHDLVAGNQNLVDGLWAAPVTGVFRNADFDTEMFYPGRSLLQLLGEQYRRSDQALDGHLDRLRFTSTPKGVAAPQMRLDQHEILDALVASYLDRLPDDVADVEQAKVARGSQQRPAFCLGRLARTGPAALLPGPGKPRAARVRQHGRESHPFRMARPRWRLWRRSPPPPPRYRPQLTRPLPHPSHLIPGAPLMSPGGR